MKKKIKDLTKKEADFFCEKAHRNCTKCSLCYEIQFPNIDISSLLCADVKEQRKHIPNEFLEREVEINE